MRKQVLSLLVENTSGVLSHISGLFSRRGYNIDSFSAGVTADPRFTRITVVSSGDEQILEQIEKQLAKLEDVIDIKKLQDGESVCRELILVKIKINDLFSSISRYSFSSNISLKAAAIVPVKVANSVFQGRLLPDSIYTRTKHIQERHKWFPQFFS